MSINSNQSSTIPLLVSRLLIVFIMQRKNRVCLAVTNKQVNDAYKSFTTAQVFRPIENKFFSLIRGARPFARCQIDLLDLSNEAPRQNQGFKWLFILLDTCTRYVFAIPMKNKSASSCVDAFTLILNKLPSNIVQLDSDSERAFTSA